MYQVVDFIHRDDTHRIRSIGLCRSQWNDAFLDQIDHVTERRRGGSTIVIPQQQLGDDEVIQRDGRFVT